MRVLDTGQRFALVALQLAEIHSLWDRKPDIQPRIVQVEDFRTKLDRYLALNMYSVYGTGHVVECSWVPQSIF